mgnify:CR=1 FL=1
MTDSQTPGSDTAVLLQPRDPLIFRDARPFGAEPGARAFSLGWPLPRSISGALRTHVVNAPGPVDWGNKANADAALKIAVHGPLLAARPPCSQEWQPYVPAPKDLIAYRNDDDPNTLHLMPLRPMAPLPEGGGCDFPSIDHPPEGAKESWAKAMEHVELRPLGVTTEAKPEKLPAFWSLDQTKTWLASGSANLRACLHKEKDQPEQLPGIAALPKQEQVHVSIDRETRTAKEGLLFTTEAIAFRDEPIALDEPALAMLCRVRSANSWTPMGTEMPLGGERRLTSLTAAGAVWPAPSALPMPKPSRLRLQLVTPSIFTHGWLPGWMVDAIPPGLNGSKLELRLVGVASDRRGAVSGWRLAKRAASPRHSAATPAGPKATIYAVPAGSVYFFEVVRGEITEEVWQKLWLAPVSDQEPHRNEGFGLVLPGIW